MQRQDYTSGIKVDVSPEEAYESITNVSGWWSKDFEGKSEHTGDVLPCVSGKPLLQLK